MINLSSLVYWNVFLNVSEWSHSLWLSKPARCDLRVTLPPLLHISLETKFSLFWSLFSLHTFVQNHSSFLIIFIPHWLGSPSAFQLYVGPLLDCWVRLLLSCRLYPCPLCPHCPLNSTVTVVSHKHEKMGSGLTCLPEFLLTLHFWPLQNLWFSYQISRALRKIFLLLHPALSVF